MDTLYFDNAATSWPKPPGVSEAMRRYLEETGGSPGRSGHRLSVEAGRIVFGARDRLAALFGAGDPLRIALTRNATEALNFAAFGLLSAGDHVITSGMEHNSVMRPLRRLERSGLEVSVVPCSAAGELDPADCIPLIKKNTKAIFLTHASNVTGTIMPLREVGAIARERGIVFCVDAAQTAGAVPIDVDEMMIDLLAFTGHKSLLGPQGTGGLFVREGLEKRMQPVVMGGTGSRSEQRSSPISCPTCSNRERPMRWE
jgi:selenocysteine lyase/cysteine desulfurase